MKSLRSLFQTNDSFGPLALRVFLAAVLFPHGAQKLLGWFGGYGYSGTMQFFTQNLGIPAPFAFFAIVTEFFGPIALILGFNTRITAFATGTLITVAALMVHVPNGFFMNWTGAQKGEGIEYHLLMAAISVALVIQGAGKWALDSTLARVIRSAPASTRPAAQPELATS